MKLQALTSSITPGALNFRAGMHFNGNRPAQAPSVPMSREPHFGGFKEVKEAFIKSMAAPDHFTVGTERPPSHLNYLA